MGEIPIQVPGFLEDTDEVLVERVNSLLNRRYPDIAPFYFTVGRITRVSLELDEYGTLKPGYVCVWID
jgi:hypothetical protein